MRSYAIGDIHGHLNKLHILHDRIADDMAVHGAAPIVHVGDLVDRGPDSAGVIEYLMTGLSHGQDWVVLKGNHDRMFAGFIRNHAYQDPRLFSGLSWLHPRLGGAATLASYGVMHPSDRPVPPVHRDAQAAVPETHLAFIENLPVWHQRGEVIFVHAGIRPGIPMALQVEDDLVWIREPFLIETASHGALIVHGHTALDEPVHYGNRLNIDSGAAYGGPMTAVVIEGTEVFHLTAAGRVPLRPLGR
jgi:serine/threonine protein phosphatase 1